MSERVVTVNDTMQHGYQYVCTAPIGKSFDPEFTPDLTPKEMLEMGVFGGKYMTDCRDEFPASWFTHAKLIEPASSAKVSAPRGHDASLNYFEVNASQPLAVWRTKGWIYADDPRGWFQWYCRYYMGRRLSKEDARQIKRWKMIRRHVGQIVHNCRRADQNCRPRQRQALLHWAYDSTKI